jgi:hypothetical protein
VVGVPLKILTLELLLSLIKILRVLEVESEDKGLVDPVIHSRITRTVIARTVIIIVSTSQPQG